MSYIAVLGRLPNLGVAELESVYDANDIELIRSDIVKVDTNEPFIINHLGGTLKIGLILDTFYSTDANKIIDHLGSLLPYKLSKLKDSKMNLGLSFYGFDLSVGKINALGLSLKKTLKSNGLNVRMVPNKEPSLNTAQVLHNKLTLGKGREILIIKNKVATIITVTSQVQDIDAYASRDQARPARDARVGMLPPKLAQTIINLSGFKPDQVLLDPFCGTGVVLQEASLMYPKLVYGTDLEPRMIDYSKQNLDWFGVPADIYKLEVADATTYKWTSKFDVIACETYLGRPLSSAPPADVLQKIIQDCDTIHKKFLQNTAGQTKKGFKMCIAVPAWRTKNGFKHLPTLDNLKILGYNRMSFVHVDTKSLFYHRDNQHVARELVVLERI